MVQILIEKSVRTPFFSKVNTAGLDDGGFFEDDSGSRLLDFSEDE